MEETRVCLEAEPVGCTEVLLLGVGGKKRGFKVDGKIWGWINWKNGVTIF